ncbi:hypothetical protein H632_c262p2 [Helicosporidium sp. ATCC 50920]|nr:hypothetical protein H632_c262p2 [Helicosporidium sp. ATCC 50920]|eukprot:KDD76340.1 hypothetical protein H632_c262p2 [Helicosporidium sp. ATCC 50920]
MWSSIFQVDADEAQEVDDMDEIDALFSKRKRRDGVNEAGNRAIVENMLAQMEIAVEEDMKAYEEGVLKAWIEPMPDGTLPNTKIRSSVLQLLGALPIDCAFEDRKAQLKRSGLGRAVLFLAKVPGESHVRVGPRQF